MKNLRSLAYFVTAVLLKMATQEGLCMAGVQPQLGSAEQIVPMPPIAAPGDRVMRRIPHFKGARGTVTLVIIQGRELEGKKYIVEDPDLVAARVCIVGTRRHSCYSTSLGETSSYTGYRFTTVEKAEPVKIEHHKWALLLWTTRPKEDHCCTLISLLILSPRGKLISMVPDWIFFHPGEEYVLWRAPKISPYLLLTKAYPWPQSEIHPKPPAYSISTLQYCPELHRYIELAYWDVKLPVADAAAAKKPVLTKSLMRIVRKQVSRKGMKCKLPPWVHER